MFWRFIESLNHIVHKIFVVLFGIYLVFLGAEELEKYSNFLDLSETVRSNLNIILYLLVATSTVINVVTFLLLRFFRNRLRTTTTERQTAAAERDDLVRKLARYRGCEVPARVLAQKNAHCDKDLFRYLFIDLLYGDYDQRAAIRMSRAIITRNLVEILDATSAIFGHITGETCAACVQVFILQDENKLNALVETKWRDSTSSDVRSGVAPSNRVRDSGAHIDVFVKGIEMVIVENVRGRIASGAITTNSEWAGKLYNAFMVKAIPSIDPATSADNTVAVLCIDNENGGFNDSLCLHFARELAWRLSVMLYRLGSLQLEYDRFESSSGSGR